MGMNRLTPDTVPTAWYPIQGPNWDQIYVHVQYVCCLYAFASTQNTQEFINLYTTCVLCACNDT